MKTVFKSLIVTLGVSALMLSPLMPDLSVVGAGAAFAKNDGGGNGGGNGGGKGGGEKSGGKGGADKASGNRGGAGKASGSHGGARAQKATPKTAEPSKMRSAKATAGHGALASELKGMNAVHASPQALANAAPNSQVGRIASYREAALGTIEAEAGLAEAVAAAVVAELARQAAESDLAALDGSYEGRTAAEVADDIAGLDPAAADYQDKLDTLTAEQETALAHEADRAALVAAAEDAATAAAAAAEAEELAAATALAAAETEDAALISAANGRTLSEPAIGYIRAQLGL